MALVLWHNPRCSKSRQALKQLEDAGQAPSIRLYLKEPPTTQELKNIFKLLDLAPKDVVRTGEKIYRELGLKDADNAEIIDAMSRHPILIERPIAICGDQAVIGRPPERVLALI